MNSALRNLKVKRYVGLKYAAWSNWYYFSAYCASIPDVHPLHQGIPIQETCNSSDEANAFALLVAQQCLFLSSKS